MCPRGVSSAQQGNGKALGTWSHLHNPTNCTVWLKGCSWGMSLCKQHDSTAQHCTALPHQVYFALYFFQFGFLVDFVGFGVFFFSPWSLSWSRPFLVTVSKVVHLVLPANAICNTCRYPNIWDPLKEKILAIGQRVGCLQSGEISKRNYLQRPMGHFIDI